MTRCPSISPNLETFKKNVENILDGRENTRISTRDSWHSKEIEDLENFKSSKSVAGYSDCSYIKVPSWSSVWQGNFGC